MAATASLAKYILKEREGVRKNESGAAVKRIIIKRALQ